MPIPLIIVLSILGAFLIIFIIVLFSIYHLIFYSPKKWQSNDYALDSSPVYKGKEEIITKLIDDLKARPFEDINIKSFDKLNLHARLFENKGSNKVAILCHGYRGTGYRDFCGGAKEAIELGYNVVLIDHRAHGGSQGHSITFGIKESKDLVSWIEYAKKRFGEDIELALIGISMGGATVLMVADKLNNAKIIADCPFTSPKIMLKETVRALKLPVPLLYPLICLAALIFAHVNINKGSAFDSIKNTTNKVLIIHGDNDQIVPHWISRDLYETYKDKIQYEVFPGAAHGMSYIEDTSRYQKIIKDYLNN